MTTDIAITENSLIIAKAAEYRSQGYEVTREEVLDFLPGNYRAGLVLRKDGLARVVDVKARSSLAAWPRPEQLAKIINARPGWSYELLLVGEPERRPAPAQSRPFEKADIIQRLNDAETLAAAAPEAAFLLAWSAAEAATRRLVAARGITIANITTPGYLLNYALSCGAIYQEDYDLLTGLMPYRNAIVHGFTTADFDPQSTARLVATARRLVAGGRLASDMKAFLNEIRVVSDADGKPYDAAGLDWLAGAFSSHYPPAAPPPRIYPAPTGAINLAWIQGDNSADLEIDLSTHRAEWLRYDRKSDSAQERDLNLNDATDWNWLGVEVRQLAAGA